MARTQQQGPNRRTPKKKETLRATSRNPSLRSTINWPEETTAKHPGLFRWKAAEDSIANDREIMSAVVEALPQPSPGAGKPPSSRRNTGQLAKELAARRPGLASRHIARIAATGRCRQIMLNTRRATMKTQISVSFIACVVGT